MEAKREAIRLYVDRSFNISEIATLINRNKSEIRRWLIAAGVYHSSRSSARKTDPVRMASEVVLWKDVRSTKKPILSFVNQRKAWALEWRGADVFDDNCHWGRHPDKVRYYVKHYYWEKAYRKTCLKNPNYKRGPDPSRKQSEAFAVEWKGVKTWEDNFYWSRHSARKLWYQGIRASIRRKTDMNYRIRLTASTRMRLAIKAARTQKLKNSSELCGCSWPDLVAYLESKFKPGMTWENYGSYWHIDHKRPCASFDLTKPEDQSKCFHFTNLQPLPALENLRKNAKYALATDSVGPLPSDTPLAA